MLPIFRRLRNWIWKTSEHGPSPEHHFWNIASIRETARSPMGGAAVVPPERVAVRPERLWLGFVLRPGIHKAAPGPGGGWRRMA